MCPERIGLLTPHGEAQPGSCRHVEKSLTVHQLATGLLLDLSRARIHLATDQIGTRGTTVVLTVTPADGERTQPAAPIRSMATCTVRQHLGPRSDPPGGSSIDQLSRRTAKRYFA